MENAKRKLKKSLFHFITPSLLHFLHLPFVRRQWTPSFMNRLLRKLNIPAYLLYAFVFLLPWQTRWIFVDATIPFEQMSIYSFDIVLLILLEIVTVKLIKQSWYKHDSGELTSAGWIIVFASALSIIGLLSAAWAPYESLALYNGLRLLAGLALLWIIPHISFKWRTLFIAFSISVGIQAFIGITQFITQDILIVSKWLGSAAHHAFTLGTSVIETSTGRWLRAYGTQSHPNIFGGFMVVGAITISYLINQYNARNTFSTGRLIATIGLILCITGLVFSWSRSAWIAFLLAGLITLFTPIYETIKDWLAPLRMGQTFELTYTRIYEMRCKIIKTLLSILVIILLAIIYTPLFTTRFHTETRLEQLGITQRLDGFTYAGEIISTHYATGAGIGNFTPIVQQLHPDVAWYTIQPVHNIYALIVSELGIGALLLFAGIIIIAILHQGTGIFTHHITHRHITLITLLIALLVISDFDHYVWTYPSMHHLFWLIIALIIHPKTDNVI